MKQTNLDEKWTFRRGLLDSLGIIASNPGEIVNLPHDGMISLLTVKATNLNASSDVNLVVRI